MESKEIFSQRLVQLREDRGITQQTLADDLKITRQSLSLYEKAERTINIDLLVKIANYFNVSADYLLGLNENATTDTDLKAVCDYTGLSENTVHLLNLLNQVKQLNITDFQPPIIDIFNSIFSEIDDGQYYFLFLLRDAINTNINKDDEKSIDNVIKSLNISNINYRLLSGSEYRDYIMQKCNDFIIQLTNSVLHSMSGDYSQLDKAANEILKELGRDSLTQICERIIDINDIKQEDPDNGEHNPKNE